MSGISISEEKFHKVLEDVENLIEDVAELLDQDEIVKKRMADIKLNPSIGKSEKDIDAYLKKRGVKID